MCSRDDPPDEAGDDDTAEAPAEQKQVSDPLPTPPQKPMPSSDPFFGKHL